MLNSKKSLGDFGENFTVKYLKKNGYKIVSQNFHSRYGEIDIIAVKNDILAFVEVKARAHNSLFKPREAVDYYKQNKIIKTAQLFMMAYNSNIQPRFDVSEVVVIKTEKDKYKVLEFEYIENAFSVG
ncbi:MAG: YraN family protein [Oscillospiraceae bacterium]|nr:YraN family protein [Oscillospiraceae bacterium]